MVRPQQIVCDGRCGKVKSDSNHWWQLGIGEPFIVFLVPYTDTPILERLSEHTKISLREFDFCGQECALRFLSEQMWKVQE